MSQTKTTNGNGRSLEQVTASAAPVPGFVGQATAVEQSRAVAEVQAAVVVAQQMPRSVQSAIAEIDQSCRQHALAERAFYRYPRAGGTVTGPSIHLARELARCWGNVQYGIAELRRDDQAGESEIQAWAWDLQTNTRNSQTFIVPHRRDTRDGTKSLTDLRDIYENNANQGARRVREAIFAVLPPWLVEQAKTLCNATLADGGGKPLAQRVADAVRMFDATGVVVEQLEQKLGRNSDRWTEHDVAQLGVIYKSLQRGEVTVEEEFPPQRVTAAEITGKAPDADEAYRSGYSTGTDHGYNRGHLDGSAGEKRDPRRGQQTESAAVAEPEPAPEPEQPQEPERVEQPDPKAWEDVAVAQPPDGGQQ